MYTAEDCDHVLLTQVCLSALSACNNLKGTWRCLERTPSCEASTQAARKCTVREMGFRIGEKKARIKLVSRIVPWVRRRQRVPEHARTDGPQPVQLPPSRMRREAVTIRRILLEDAEACETIT